MTLSLAEMVDGGLDAFDDLILIIYLVTFGLVLETIINLSTYATLLLPYD
jgi:hypothetical protein